MKRCLVGLFLLVTFVNGCKKSEVESSQKTLLTFSFTKSANPSLLTDATGIISGLQVTMILPAGTKINALKASFSTSPLSAVSVGGARQESGVTSNDFSSPITYLVTAEDGSTAEYRVTITVAKSTDKAFTSFSFLTSVNPDLPADIGFTGTNNELTAILPAGAKPTGLKASFAVSPAATVTLNGVKQESGVTVNDFTNSLTYRVTAEDGSSADYFITVTVAKSSEKQILSFSLSSLNPVVQATIDQAVRRITATVPAKTNITVLAPQIGVSPKATVTPASGTAQNFTNPVSYTVVAEDGSSQVYQVVVDIRQVSSVPAELNLHNFYKKYIDGSGIPIISSEKVPDAALIQARNTVNQMVEKIPDVVAKMIQNKTRLAIMAETEVTTDIPEHSDLYTAFPGTDWNTRSRGLGATIQRPAVSCAEENLLCYPSDRYLGEDILVHEFSHAIHSMGIAYLNPNFDKELETIYKEAMAKGLWSNTYAASNYVEYWGEGVQCWYDLNKEAIPSNGIHNQINTREELKTYDPKLYELISRYFNVPSKKVSCQVGK